MRSVLIINWRGPDHPQAGGAEVYLAELARRWAAAGVNVTLFCAHQKNRPFASETSRADGIVIRSMGNRFTVYLLAALYLLLRGRDYDRIIDAANGIPFFAPLFTKTQVTLLVHHIHRLQWTMEFPRPVAALGWFLERRVVPFLYKDQPVITISSTTSKDLQALGFDPRQIWIVHPGLSNHPAEGVSQPDSAPRTKGGPQTKGAPQTKGGRILYVGRLKAYKQVDLLVRAFDLLHQEFPGAHLDIVGRGPQFEALRDLVLRLGLDDAVTLHGYLDEQAKVRLLSQATVFATASLMEGWGLGVLEANSHGVPVVAYRVPGLAESVRHLDTGLLVPPGAPVEVFAGAIGRILGDQALRNRLALGGLRWARHFTWDDSARRARWVAEHGQKSLPRRQKQASSGEQGLFAWALKWLNNLPGRPVVFGSFAATSLVNYGFGLLMAALLLPGDFGLLAFSQTLLLLAGLVLSSGYSWSLTAALPRADKTERGRLVRGMLLHNFLLALALSGVLVLLFALGPLRGGLERWSIALLLALTFPFLSVIAIGRGTMRGIEAFGSMGIIQVSEVAAKLLGGLAFVALGFGPEGAVAGFLVGAVLAASLSLVLVNRQLNISPLGTIARISPIAVSSMFAAVLGLALLLNLDILAVKLFAGENRALTGHYQAAIMLANIPYFMATALLAVLFPQLAAVGYLARTGPRLAETLRLILLFLIPVGLALALAPAFFLTLFFPDSYVAGAPFLRILAIGNMALILAATFSNAFQATGLARIPAAVLLSIVAAEGIGLWLLVPVWQATAAATLFSAGGLLALLLLGGAYLKRLEGVELQPVFGWLGRYCLALALAAAAAVAILYWTGRPLIALLAGTVVYGFVLVAAGLRPFAFDSPADESPGHEQPAYESLAYESLAYESLAHESPPSMNSKQKEFDAYSPPGL